MEYQTKAYFVEHEEPQVKGFSIIDTNDGEYHIAEKWNREEGEGGAQWLQYWIPEAQLLSRVRDGACEKKGSLTDEQFEAVCDNVPHDKVVATV